jgi:hypothetical protein
LVNAGKSTIAKQLCNKGWNHFSIDECRKQYATGTYAGEYRSWSSFLNIAEHPPGTRNIFEFSGVGDNKKAFKETIKASDQSWKVIYCIISDKTAKERQELYNEKLKSVTTPYKEEHFDDITLEEIMRLYKSNYYERPQKLIQTDSKPIEDNIKDILNFITNG